MPSTPGRLRRSVSRSSGRRMAADGSWSKVCDHTPSRARAPAMRWSAGRSSVTMRSSSEPGRALSTTPRAPGARVPIRCVPPGRAPNAGARPGSPRPPAPGAGGAAPPGRGPGGPPPAPAPPPPFANTGVDGYAVRAADTAGATPDTPVRLKVVDELPAGKAPTVPVKPGEAIRIMTGAPAPEGADAIVMVEDTTAEGDRGGGAEFVVIRREARPGDHVRPAGGDLAVGETAFPAGSVLGPAHLGVVNSLGQSTVNVVRRARVAVLSPGDELVPPGEPLRIGQIRDSNRPMLLALVAQTGCEPVDFGIGIDDEAVITELLEKGVSSCDA